MFSPLPHTTRRAPLHDTFDRLSPAWSTLRTPRTLFWTVGAGLRLRLRPERLGEPVNPSLLVRPQEDLACEVFTELDFTPAGAHEHAGLAVVLDDNAHLLLVRTVYGLAVLQGAAVLATEVVPAGPVRLGVRIRGFTHTFGYATGSGQWHDLVTMDATFLRPLFTGVQVGLYAGSNGQPSDNEALFTRFDYLPHT